MFELRLVVRMCPRQTRPLESSGRETPASLRLTGLSVAQFTTRPQSGNGAICPYIQSERFPVSADSGGEIYMASCSQSWLVFL